MQTISPAFRAELQANPRRRVELWEFFAQDEVDFSPAKAQFRFGTAKYIFQGFEYASRVLNRGDIKRYLGKETNRVSLSLNNADLLFSGLVNQFRFEGMWAQCRIPSVTVLGESLVIFGGRCQKPDMLNHLKADLSIIQDLAGGEQEIPARTMETLCPLAADFKGEACRGLVPLTSKSAQYQAATECPGTRRACVYYENEANFQGVLFRPISGTFSYQVEEAKRFLIFFRRRVRRTVSAPWSSVSDANEDKVIPEVGGVVQVETVPVMHADTGTRVRYLGFIADGEIDGIFEPKIRDKEYLPAPDFVELAYGKYGSQGQPEVGKFPGAGKFSGTAWIACDAIGSNPSDANDSAPTVTVVARGRKIALPNATGEFTERGWSDCGVYLTRHYLTTLGRIPVELIDDQSVIEAAIKTFEPVIDDTGAEQAVLPNTLTGGIDFRAFAAASGFGAATIDRIVLMMAQGRVITGGYGQLVDAYYRYINQTRPPAYITPLRKVRRRYTSNYVLMERQQLRDFLHDILLPSFNGQLIFSAAGRVQIKVDAPADNTYLVEDTNLAASPREITVEDITRWQRNLNKLCLIGAHQSTAQVNKVLGARYAGLTDPITLTVTATGTITATASGNLTGGDSTKPDRAVVTLGGSVSAGAKVTITLDGQMLDYTAQAGDDMRGIAGYLSALVNGHSRLRRYVRAVWNDGLTITLETKIGVLTLESNLAANHNATEEVIRIAAAFGGASPYDQKILENTFEWPLGSRQSATNQVYGAYRSVVNDWSTDKIVRDSTAHQKQTHTLKKEEINLSAVDTAHQAARLLKIALGKKRLCDWFCDFSATGDALLLDVGDVIAVSHYTGAGNIQSIPVVIEDLTLDKEQRSKIIGRLYKSEIYDDTINEIGPQILMPLQTGTATNTDTPSPNQPRPTGAGNSGLGDDPYPVDYPHGHGGLSTASAAPEEPNYIVIVPAPAPPVAPTVLSATAVSHTQINLAWTDNSGNETGFKIERCTGAACGTFTEIATVGANVAAYNDTGLTAETLYRYRVRATNTLGDSPYSNVAEATTQAVPVPAAPTLLTAQAISTSQINLAWTDNANNETGYKVERCAGAGCATFAEIASLGANAASYNNTGLSPNTLHRYRVRAFNAFGNSPYSNIAQATTQALPIGGLGLVLHLDPSQQVANNGDRLAQLTDFSGQNNHFAQNTAANKPRYDTGILNGKPAFFFDGAAYFATRAPLLSGQSEAEFFVVIKLPASPSGVGAWKFDGGNWASHFTYFGTIYESFGTTNRNSYTPLAASLTNGTLHQVVSKIGLSSETPYKIYQDGNNLRVQSTMLDTQAKWATAQFQIGASSGNTDGSGQAAFLHGWILDLKIYDSPRTAAQRNEILADYRTRFGLTLVDF